MEKYIHVPVDRKVPIYLPIDKKKAAHQKDNYSNLKNAFNFDDEDFNFAANDNNKEFQHFHQQIVKHQQLMFHQNQLQEQHQKQLQFQQSQRNEQFLTPPLEGDFKRNVKATIKKQHRPQKLKHQQQQKHKQQPLPQPNHQQETHQPSNTQLKTTNQQLSIQLNSNQQLNPNFQAENNYQQPQPQQHPQQQSSYDFQTDHSFNQPQPQKNQPPSGSFIITAQQFPQNRQETDLMSGASHLDKVYSHQQEDQFSKQHLHNNEPLPQPEALTSGSNNQLQQFPIHYPVQFDQTQPIMEFEPSFGMV